MREQVPEPFGWREGLSPHAIEVHPLYLRALLKRLFPTLHVGLDILLRRTVIDRCLADNMGTIASFLERNHELGIAYQGNGSVICR